MAQEKKLSPPAVEPDPEMLKKFDLLKKMEFLEMMQDMGIAEKTVKKKGKGEKK